MLRFSFSLIAAALVSMAAYGQFGLGLAAGQNQPQLKVIAVVTAHAHHGLVAQR